MNKLTKFSEDWAVSSIVAVCVGVWLLNVVSGMSAFAPNPDDLLRWGGNAASEVQAGQWWRLLTAMFLHGGAIHLALNMYALWGTGTQVTRMLGNRSFLIIYFGSGLIGSALSLHYSSQTHVSVGASGAIFGVIGALLVLLIRHKELFPNNQKNPLLINLVVFAGYSLFQGFAVSGIDNAAHIGGLIGGIVLGLFMEPLAISNGNRQPFFRNALASAASAVAMVLLVMFAPPAARNLSDFSSNVQEVDAAVSEFTNEAIKVQAQLNQDKAKLNSGAISVDAYSSNLERFAEIAGTASRRLAALSWGSNDPIGQYASAEQKHYEAIEALLKVETKAVRTQTYGPTESQRKKLMQDVVEARGKAQALREKITTNTSKS